jgi:hypothetical protein
VVDWAIQIAALCAFVAFIAVVVTRPNTGGDDLS